MRLQVRRAGGLKAWMFNRGLRSQAACPGPREAQSAGAHPRAPGASPAAPVSGCRLLTAAACASMQASRLWDLLVFKKVARRLGGRLRFVISGSAALSRHVRPCPCRSWHVQHHAASRSAGHCSCACAGQRDLLRATAPCCKAQWLTLPRQRRRQRTL